MRPTDARAVKLLAQVIATGAFEISLIARELVTDERTIGQYMSGALAMPMERQICLARFLIEHVPALRRHGHNLLSRVRARLAYETAETLVHRQAPNSRSP